MFFLGLVLLGATGAFTGLLIADNWSGSPDYTVTMLGNNVATMNSVAIFLSGIAMTLIFGLAIVLTLGGGSRMRRRAGERRSLREQARQAVADRDALQDRMDRPPTPMPANQAAADSEDEVRATHSARSHNWFRIRHGH